jgi:hypothetical protein
MCWKNHADCISYELCFIHKCHKAREVRSVPHHWQNITPAGNLSVTRPANAAAAVLAALSRQSNERHPVASLPFVHSFQELHSRHPEYPPLLQGLHILVHLWWWQRVQNSQVHIGSNEYLQTSSSLDISVPDTFLGTDDKPPQHFRPRNDTYCIMFSWKSIQRETHLLGVAAMSVQLVPAGSQHLGNLGNRFSLVTEFDSSPSLTDTRQQFN